MRRRGGRRGGRAASLAAMPRTSSPPPVAAPRRFDWQYRERCCLRDGTAVLLRPITPSDREALAEGFSRLSEESRYRRFFAPKRELNEAELRYLTELDGEQHFAIGALVDAEASERGLAVARFVRLLEQPDIAEPAIAILDEAHGKGLGTLLLVRLAAAALERGVTHFRTEVLADNEPMLAMLHTLAPTAVVERRSNVLVLSFELEQLVRDHLIAGDPDGPVMQFLAAAASQLDHLRRIVERIQHEAARPLERLPRLPQLPALPLGATERWIVASVERLPDALPEGLPSLLKATRRPRGDGEPGQPPPA